MVMGPMPSFWPSWVPLKVIVHWCRLLLQPDEISVGDFVLNGGEVAAMTIIDTVIRLVPDVLGGVAARSVYLGFEPFYFKPSQVKEMFDVILFDEWQLQRL